MIDAIKNQRVVRRISLKRLFKKREGKKKIQLASLKRRLSIKRIEFFAHFRYVLHVPFRKLMGLLDKIKGTKLIYPIGVTIITLLFALIAFVIPVDSLFARGPALRFPEDDISSLLLEYANPEYGNVSDNDFQEIDPEQFAELELVSYTVKSGDTISEIAQNHGLRMDTVISINQIKDVRRLRAGTVIKLPSRNGLLYTVGQGDSLESIGSKHNISVNSILDANNLESGAITKGQSLFIPGARMTGLDLKRALGELFIYPTQGRLTSYFGMRNDPFTGVRRFHNGVDLANKTGTTISAALGGTVKSVAVHPSYGKYVIISHPYGFQTWYAHMNKITVKTGQYISQGQSIGEMGNTGYSTGSHLHFAIFKRGAPVDPLGYLH